MSKTLAGIRYARALFELAQKSDQLDEVDLCLTRFADGIKRSSTAMTFMLNPIIHESEKIRFIEELFPEGTARLLKDFSKVLVEKKRFLILQEVREIFHGLYERARGVLEVELLSAAPFSEKLRDKLTKVLSQKLRSEIRLIPKTETALIGGFVLRFDGKEIDCSFKNRFHEIEQKLFSSIEEGNS